MGDLSSFRPALLGFETITPQPNQSRTKASAKFGKHVPHVDPKTAGIRESASRFRSDRTGLRLPRNGPRTAMTTATDDFKLTDFEKKIAAKFAEYESDESHCRLLWKRLRQSQQETAATRSSFPKAP